MRRCSFFESMRRGRRTRTNLKIFITEKSQTEVGINEKAEKNTIEKSNLFQLLEK